MYLDLYLDFQPISRHAPQVSREDQRDGEVGKEVNDFVTGHASGDVAGKYGSGPSLKVRKEAIERLKTNHRA